MDFAKNEGIPEIFKFSKYANYKVMMSVHPTNLIKYDEKDNSANLNQKRLIRCSKILINVLHNTSFKVLLPR